VSRIRPFPRPSAAGRAKVSRRLGLRAQPRCCPCRVSAERGLPLPPERLQQRWRRPLRRRVPPAQIEDAQAAESVTQTVFTLPYKVSVTAGQSLVLPILDRGLPATRIDLYQSSVDQHHPLAAIALANDGRGSSGCRSQRDEFEPGEPVGRQFGGGEPFQSSVRRRRPRQSVLVSRSISELRPTRRGPELANGLPR